MASHKLLRGYVYAGISLVISLLVIINSAPMVKVTKVYGQPPQMYEITSVSATCTSFLVRTVISTVFTLSLIFGMFKRRVNFVWYYIWYLATFYVIEMIGLIIGCIVCGFLIGKHNIFPLGIENASGLVMLVTTGFCSLIVLDTLFYCLVRWILSGVIDHIKHDISRLDSAKGIVPEYEDCF